MNIITLEHGSGGKTSHKLIQDVFFKYFKNDVLDRANDSAIVDVPFDKIAFTTDTFVVKPIFFPGGDIGKIAVCGTVNDLAVVGAQPKYMSCGFILEEGLLEEELKKIVISMAETAKQAGVSIVTGDTKVVARGEVDKIFINTSGVGVFTSLPKIGVDKIKPGDRIIISGTIGDHGIAVLGKRKGLEFESEICSDCAPLNIMLNQVLGESDGIRFMRDPTRGGLATTLNEITEGRNFGVTISEENVPIKEATKGACELLGLDPLYIANEGKAVIVVDAKNADNAVSILKKNEYGKDACIIGEVTEESPGKVCLKTRYGVTRIIGMLTGEQLPRIC